MTCLDVSLPRKYSSGLSIAGNIRRVYIRRRTTIDNEELKKKIIEVLRDNREYELRYYPDDNYTEVVIDYEAIADVLIEAGLVADVQSLADGGCVLYVKDKGIMRLYNEQDINKMIHRAEVAERALLNMTKKYNLAERKIATTKDGWFSLGEAQIALLVDDAIKQAEKDLAEEEGRNV